jgi:hypothetical protein
MYNRRWIEAAIIFLLGNLSIFLASLIQQHTILMGWQIWSYFESHSFLFLSLSCFAAATFAVSVWNQRNFRIKLQPELAAIALLLSYILIGLPYFLNSLAVGLGSALSDNGNVDHTLPLWVIIATAVLAPVVSWGSLTLILKLAQLQTSRRLNLAHLLLAAIVLVGLLPPWSFWLIESLPPSSRDALAQRTFGRTYEFSKALISNCPAFLDYTGKLEKLAISSSSRNKISNFGQMPGQKLGTYDFDYVATQNRGSVLIAVLPRQKIQPDGTKQETFVSGWSYDKTITLHIFPNYQNTAVYRACIANQN